MDWKKLLAYISGSVDEELLLRNEYLVTENRILRAQIKGRLKLTDGERKTLAEIGKKLGRKVLEEVASIVKPETILAWHRRLVAKKFDGSKNRTYPGRPKIDAEVEDRGICHGLWDFSHGHPCDRPEGLSGGGGEDRPQTEVLQTRRRRPQTGQPRPLAGVGPMTATHCACVTSVFAMRNGLSVTRCTGPSFFSLPSSSSGLPMSNDPLGNRTKSMPVFR